MNIMIYINLSPCYCTITAYIIYGRYIGAIEACYTILMCSIRYCNTFNIFSFILKTFKTKKGMALHVNKKHDPKFECSFIRSVQEAWGDKRTNPSNVNRKKPDSSKKICSISETFSAKLMNIMMYDKKWSTSKRSKQKEDWLFILRRNTIQSMCFLVSSIRSWPWVLMQFHQERIQEA